jgi:transglutaminase-like putative cysteine protease
LKKLFTITASIIVICILSMSVKASDNMISINKEHINSGILELNYNLDEDIIYKLMVSKEKQKYYYTLDKDLETDCFPLQMGNGRYDITLLELQEDNSYRSTYSQALTLYAKDDTIVFRNSVHLINWNEDMKAIKIAKDLTKGVSDKEEKIRIIYDYIINSLEYDNEKAENVTIGYTPSIDYIMEAKKGICYDYSVLFAAMLRSEDIPAKLVMGYTDKLDDYHAWNEVYNEKTEEWMIIDTTYDSLLAKAGVKSSMEKNKSEYHNLKEY